MCVTIVLPGLTIIDVTAFHDAVATTVVLNAEYIINMI